MSLEGREVNANIGDWGYILGSLEKPVLCIGINIDSKRLKLCSVILVDLNYDEDKFQRRHYWKVSIIYYYILNKVMTLTLLYR